MSAGVNCRSAAGSSSKVRTEFPRSIVQLVVGQGTAVDFKSGHRIGATAQFALKVGHVRGTRARTGEQLTDLLDGIRIVEIQSDDGQPVGRLLPGERHRMWQLLDARQTPGGPTIDEHHFALEARQDRVELRSINKRYLDGA